MLLAMTRINGLYDFQDLYRRTEISPVFIDAVLGCWAGDLQWPFVGTILDTTILPAVATKTQWYQNTRNFLWVTTQLLFWLDYDTNPSLNLRLLMPISQDFFPNSGEIKAAMDAFIYHAQQIAYESATLYPSIFEWLALCEQALRDVTFRRDSIEHIRHIALKEE